MTHFLKYLSIFALTITLLGCQDDSSDETAQQKTTQQQQGQQAGPMGQMQQQVPDVDVSDEEAATFADAAMNAQKIQIEAQKKMISLIEDEGLDIETYQKIARSKQMGQSADSGDFTNSEMDKFDAATSSIQEIQPEIREDVTSAIEETGMKMKRFQDISRAAQQDSALQIQIQQKMQERMKTQMQQQAPSSQN